MRGSAMRRETARVSVALALLGAVGACQNQQERTPLPDWSDGYDIERDGGADGSVISVPTGGFGLAIPSAVDYPARLYEVDSHEAPCAISLGDADHNDIRCILDMDELDLFVLGFQLDVLTPRGGCDFVLYQPYIYESWPIGAGPEDVSFNVQDDQTFSDEVNSENGVPVCPFDYRRTTADGPNCCTGDYTLTRTSAKTGKVSEEHLNWGGPDPECLDGAAFLRDGASFDANGFPLDPIYRVNRQEQVIHIKHQSLSDKYLGVNIPLANYWDDADGAPPGALSSSLARPDYTFLCLDDAEEVQGRIRLQVREWNEEVEFDAKGDPDTSGSEAKFDSPVNDLLDWKDMADQNVDFPRVLRPK